MTVTFAVRRTRKANLTGFTNTQPRDEYLFLTADTMRVQGQDNVLAPMLPGNDATDVAGAGSSNFVLNLGFQQTVLRISGTVVAFNAVGDYPTTLPTGLQEDGVTSKDSARFIVENGGTNPNATEKAQNVSQDNLAASIPIQTAVQIRECLLDFWADQSRSDFNAFHLVWPGWGASDDQSNVPVTGTNSRVWEGNMRMPDIVEVAGETNQFPFTFLWVVGDV